MNQHINFKKIIMMIPSKIKSLLILSILIFNCEASVSDTTYKKKAEKIVEFIVSNASITPSASTGKNNYVGQILTLLEDKAIFNTITKKLIEKNSLPQKEELTQAEKGILLSLCLYQYSKDTGLNWSQVSDKFGIFPDINLFFDTSEYPSDHNKGYATYQISPNKILFLQLLGRGANNGSYFLWSLTIEEGKFKAVLLDIPHYVQESKSFQVQPDFLARFCFYNSDKEYFVINIKRGNVHGWKSEENTYHIKDDKLTLIQSCLHKIVTQCITSFCGE